MTKNTDCIFCKIAREEIPSMKIYEDEQTFAFLDIKPVNIGHTLVIPKTHYINIFDLGEEMFSPFLSTIQKVARAQKKGLGAEGVSIRMNNEKAGGQVIFHSHTHIIPRYGSDGLEDWKGKEHSKEAIEDAAKRLREHL